MCIVLSIVLLISVFLGQVAPAFAEGFSPLESQVLRSIQASDFSKRPIYNGQYEYILEHKCKAKGMIPYSGDVIYQCEGNKMIMSDVLVPVPSNPEIYQVNRKRINDDDALIASSTVSASAALQ